MRDKLRKTQLRVLTGNGNQVIKPCFVRLAKAYRCVKFILSLVRLRRIFCGMTKEQETEI
jgi:hypothetical protein